MYADRETAAMKQAIEETYRRRAKQTAYNEEHGITPASIVHAILDFSPSSGTQDYYAVPKGSARGEGGSKAADPEVDLADRVEALRQEMFAAAENLDFEKAARLRDQIRLVRGDADVAQVAAPRLAATKAARGSGARASGRDKSGRKSGRGGSFR